MQKNKKWVTLIELIVVIAIIAILGVAWFVWFNIVQQDAAFTKDNETVNNVQKDLVSFFTRDHIVLNSARDREIKYITTEARYDSPTTGLTVGEFKNLYRSSIPSGQSINSVAVCGSTTDSTTLDALSMNANGRTQKHIELVLLVGNGSTCFNDADVLNTVAPLSTNKLVGYLLRYKNNLIAESVEYENLISKDWGARINSTAKNAVGENVFGAFTRTLSDNTDVVSDLY